MNMNAYSVILLSFMLVVSACSSNLSVDEIIQKTGEKASQSQSYHTDMQMITTMNSSSGNDSLHTMSLMQIKTDVDLENKEMYQELTMEVLGQRAQSISIIKDNAQYSQVAGTWYKIPVEEGMFVDQLGDLILLLESSEVKKISDENIDGQEYYVLRVSPDRALAGKQVAAMQTMELTEDTNLEEIISQYTTIVYVNKETFMIDKADTQTTMNLNNDLFNTSSDNQFITEFSEFNKDFQISLPPAATDAQALP